MKPHAHTLRCLPMYGMKFFWMYDMLLLFFCKSAPVDGHLAAKGVVLRGKNKHQRETALTQPKPRQGHSLLPYTDRSYLYIRYLFLPSSISVLPTNKNKLNTPKNKIINLTAVYLVLFFPAGRPPPRRSSSSTMLRRGCLTTPRRKGWTKCGGRLTG